jgi:hypothetical protein
MAIGGKKIPSAGYVYIFIRELILNINKKV